MATQVFAQKLESEQITLEVDMLSRLNSGDTVSTATCTMQVLSGTDPTPQNMLEGLATVTGSIVKQTIKGGLPGVIYILYCAIRTANNDILINEIKVAVLSDDAEIPA